MQSIVCVQKILLIFLVTNGFSKKIHCRNVLCVYNKINAVASSQVNMVGCAIYFTVLYWRQLE